MNRFILLGLLATTLLFLLQSHQGQAASTKKAEAKAVVKKSASVAKKKTSSKSSDKKAATKYAKKATKVSIKSKADKKAVSKVKEKVVSKDKKKAVSQVKKKADKNKAVKKDKKKAASKDKKKAVSKGKKPAKKVVIKGKKVESKDKKATSKKKKAVSKDGKKVSKAKKSEKKKQAEKKKAEKVDKKDKKKAAKKAVKNKKKAAKEVDKKEKKKVAEKADKKDKKKAAKKVDKKEKKKAAKKDDKKDKKKAAKKDDKVEKKKSIKEAVKKDKKAAKKADKKEKKKAAKKEEEQVKRKDKKAASNRRRKNAKVCLRRRVGYQCRTGKRVQAKSYQSCIHFCQNNKHCRSIDWNTKRRLCLLHTRAKRLHRTIHNIIHVAKVTCNRVPGRVWPKRLIGKARPAPGGCMRRIRTLYTFSVRRVAGLSTAVQCRYWCWKNKSCRYVDWDQRHRSCWTHGDLSKKQVKPRRDIHNWPYAWTYVKIRCPWYPRRRDSRENIKSKGGRDISAVYKYVSRKGSCDQKTLAVLKKTKLQQCFRACDKEKKCLSFVYRKKDDDGDDDDDDDDDEPSYPRCYLKSNYCPKLKDRDDDNVFTYNKALAAVTKLKLPGADKGDAAKSMDPCKVMECPKGSICVARPKCDKTKIGGAVCKVVPSCAKKISKEKEKKGKNVACPGKKWKKVGDECVFTPFHMFNYAIKAFKKIEMRDNRKCPAGTMKRPGKRCKVMSHKALEKTFAADQEMSRVVSLKNVEMFIRVKPGENCPDGFGRMKGEKDACQVTDEEKVRRLNRKARLKKGEKKASGADKKRNEKEKKKKLKKKVGKKEKKESKDQKKKASRKSAKKDSKNASKKGKKKVAKKEKKASSKGEKKAEKKGRKEKGGKKLSKKSNKKAGKRKSKDVSKEKGPKKKKMSVKSVKPAKKVSEKNSKPLKKGSRKSKVGKASSKKAGKKGGRKKAA